MDGMLTQLSPRMERAINLMNDEEFGRAVDVLNQELDEQPKNSVAYWLLLMAEHQCNSEDTLINRGIPFTNEKPYSYACRYATAEQQEHYKQAADKTLFFTHSNVLRCAAQNDVFRMNKWIGHYAAHCPENDLLKEIHTVLSKAGGLAVPGEYSLGIITALHAVYKELDSGVDTGDVFKALSGMFEEFSKFFSSKAVEAAKVSLKNVDFTVDAVNADATLRKRAATLLQENKDIRCWVDPAAVWEKQGGKPSLPDTLPDGSPSTGLERVRLFVTQLLDTDAQWSIDRYAVIDALFDRLNDEEARAAFHRSILARKEVTPEELQYVALRSQDGSEAAWRYVTTISRGLTVALPPLDIQKKVDTFLKKHLDDHKKREELLAFLKQKREWTLTLENQELEHIAPWAERALQAESNPYQAEWTAYTEALHAAAVAQTAACDEAINTVKQAVATFDSDLQASSEKSGKTAAIVSGVALAVAVVALVVSVYWLLAPQQVLKHSVYVLYGSLLGGWLVLRPILVAIQKAQREARRLRKKPKSEAAQYTAACRRFTDWAPHLTNVSFWLSVAALVVSLFTFNKQVGTLSIDDVDDLSLLATNPLGHYQLNADLDLQDTALPAVTFFFGEIDGNGHTVSNVAQTDASWIWHNFGEMRHLTFQNGTWQQALLHANHGLLLDVSVNGVTRTFGEVLPKAFELAVLAEDNSSLGTLADCRITDGAVTFTAEYEPSKHFRFGTFAAQNGGTVVNCHTNIPVTVNLTCLTGHDKPEFELGGLIGNNKGDLEGSSYTGKFQTTVNDQSATDLAYLYIGGLIGNNGISSRSFFNGELAVTLTAEEAASGQIACSVGAIGGHAGMNNSYAQGKLSVVCRESENKTVTPYAGALTGTLLRDDVIENSYHALACSVKTITANNKTTRCDYCIVAGVKPEFDETPDVVNSFVYGTKRAAKSCGQEDLVIQNSYKSASIFPNGKNLKPARTMTTTAFLIDTLGWSEEIWDMQNGKLPTLKPVVYTEESAEDTATTTTQQEEAK